MRHRWAVSYWMVTGALMGFGLIGLMSIGWPFLLLGTVMSLIGLLLSRGRGAWAFLAGFGGLPAMLLTVNLLRDALRVDWSCSGFTFGNQFSGSGSAGPDGEMAVCETLSGYYLVMALVFWGMVLFVILGRYAARRRRAG